MGNGFILWERYLVIRESIILELKTINKVIMFRLKPFL